MKHVFLLFISSIAFTSFSKSFDPIVIGLDIGKQNNFSELNSLSTSFSVLNKDESDSLKERRHGIYIEPWLFGAIYLGYSYEILVKNNFKLSANIGFGTLLHFNNPGAALLFPIGLEAKIRLKKRFFLVAGIYNHFYFNYWAYFSENGKNCTGMWNCPPDKELINLMPFLGTSWEWGRFALSPRVYVNIAGFWKPIPIPSVNLKLKL